MSKVIGEVNLNPSRIEGTPDQVALHIFEEMANSNMRCDS
ncbi:hypothetical protein J541_3836, partial [Acinetobacter pittii]